MAVRRLPLLLLLTCACTLTAAWEPSHAAVSSVAEASTQSPPPPPTTTSSPFGHALLPRFALRAGYLNLNHGSYGATPRAVTRVQREWQDEVELNPDDWFRYRMYHLFDAARAQVAAYVKANTSDLVFVPNASHGCNSVLRSVFPPNPKRNKILYLSTAYGMVKNTLAYLHAQPILNEDLLMVNVSYPLDHAALVKSVGAALDAHAGQVYLASFSHITSIPAMIMPVQELVRVCHARGVMVLIDGAHALGQIPLDIPSLGADFYVANGHKWLYSPKGSAILWVHPDRQAAIFPTTISGEGEGKSSYLMQFSYEGTLDYSSYMAFGAALAFRAEFGEEAIMTHNHDLAVAGGQLLAGAWCTSLFIPAEHTAAMVNVRLPTERAAPHFDPASLPRALLTKYQTWVPAYPQDGQWYVRVSAQIYNELSDFQLLADGVLDLMGIQPRPCPHHL